MTPPGCCTPSELLAPFVQSLHFPPPALGIVQRQNLTRNGPPTVYRPTQPLARATPKGLPHSTVPPAASKLTSPRHDACSFIAPQQRGTGTPNIQRKTSAPPMYRPNKSHAGVSAPSPAPALFSPKAGNGKNLIQTAEAGAPPVYRPVSGGPPVIPPHPVAQQHTLLRRPMTATSPTLKAPPIYRPAGLLSSSAQTKRSRSAKKKQPSTFRYKDVKTGEVFPAPPPVNNSSVNWVSGQDTEFDKEYEENLLKAAKSLKAVEFCSSDAIRKYDSSVWTRGKDKDGDEILILKPGQIPSEAVTSLFDSVENLSLDCIEYVQVARWYAQLQSLGKDEFNRRAGPNFKLSYHKTSGLRSRMTYLRNSRKEPFRSVDGLTNRSVSTNITLRTPEEEDRFLADLPIGSRVMWSDGNPESRDSDFENENAIKVSADRYAAHPFGIKTAAQVRKEMASPEKDTPSKVNSYIRRWVYIKEIEWYARV